MLTEDTMLWNLSREAQAIQTVTKKGEVQPWFHKNHTHDEGASSQKLDFLSVESNHALFGNDSFNVTGNHNLKVNMMDELAIDRGGEFLFINATKIQSDRNITVYITLEEFEET